MTDHGNLVIERHPFGGSARDEEIAGVLRDVYIGGGYSPAAAHPMFAAEQLSERGIAWVALDSEGAVAGTIFLVPAANRFRQVAVAPEQEVHLLAVTAARRGAGVARALLDALIAHAKGEGVPALVLSTQPTMKAAHALYTKAGFTRAPERDWARPDGRPFMVFTMTL
jgi:GNAT superfamily N-acetyltransferase